MMHIRCDVPKTCAARARTGACKQTPFNQQKDPVSSRLPPALSILHHRRGDGRGGAGHGHSRAGVDDGNNLAGPIGSRLVEINMAGIGSQATVDKRIGSCGGEGDGWCDLLHGLDLMLQRRSIGRSARQRRAIRRGGVD